jgi:hypothetical protein
MKVQRRKDGTLSVTLSLMEGLLLRSLPERLRALLAKKDFKHRMVERLFPAAYRDKARQAEYERLVGDDLRRRKLAAVDAFERTLDEWKARGKTVRVTVLPQEFDLWLGFVNDMRLLIATSLDIQQNDWSRSFDPEHPQAEDMLLLHFLSWIEESVLNSMGYRGPDPSEV